MPGLVENGRRDGLNPLPWAELALDFFGAVLISVLGCDGVAVDTCHMIATFVFWLRRTCPPEEEVCRKLPPQEEVSLSCN